MGYSVIGRLLVRIHGSPQLHVKVSLSKILNPKLLCHLPMNVCEGDKCEGDEQ